MGESILKASLRGLYSEFYIKTLPVSTGGSGVSRTQNDRGLQSIVTDLYPWTGWESFIDNPPRDSSADICLCIFTEQGAPDSSVRSNVITYASTDINVVPGPLATDI